MTTPCIQVEKITALQINSLQMAKDISDIKENIKEIGTKQEANHTSIMAKFESLDLKFATKSSVNRLRVIVWSIVGFVFTTLWVVALTSLLGK